MEKRIYIGNLLYNTDECQKQLHSRFKKFGECLNEEFESHGTFAYVNMNFENESQFQNLKRCFNNVKYQGNELRVSEAKPKWEDLRLSRLAQDTKENKVKEQEAKERERRYHKKIENIGMSWEDRHSVIKGRVRKTPRSKIQLRKATFRINVSGSLKVYKCYKTKLWGYEREKDVKDLVSKFSNNQWRNDYGHIVDRLTYQRSKQPVRLLAQIPQDDEEQESEFGEKEVVNLVLDDMLNKFDFDRPLNIDDEEEDREGRTKSILDQEESREREADFSGNSEPIFDSRLDSASNEGMIGEDTLDEKSSIEDETTSRLDAHSDGKNRQSSLKSIFHPEQKKVDSFRLIDESDDDIDRQKILEPSGPVETPEITEATSHLQVAQPEPSKKDKNLLFFPHFASPFLTGQTQLSRVKTVYNETKLENWNDDFWQSRGTWMKEAKRRKRDVMRQLKKKWTRNGSGLLL